MFPMQIGLSLHSFNLDLIFDNYGQA